MQTLTVSKDNEAMATKALSSCSLFRALKPEQIGQLLKAAELVSYEPGEVIVRQGEPSDSFLVLADGIAVVTADRGDGEVQLGEIPLPSSLGEVSLLLREPRTATVDRARERQGPEVLRQGLRGDVQEDPGVRHRPGRRPGLPAAAPLRPHRDPRRRRPPAPGARGAGHAAHGADPAPPHHAPARGRQRPEPRLRGCALHPGHHRGAGPAPLPRGAPPAHRDPVLRRRAEPPRRVEGLGRQQEEEGGAGGCSRRPRPPAEAPRARGRGRRVGPPPLRRPQAALAHRRRDEAHGRHARPRRRRGPRPAEPGDGGAAPQAVRGRQRLRLRLRPSRAPRGSASTSSATATASSAVMRQIPSKILTFEQLALPPVVQELLRDPQGPRPRHRPHRQRQVHDPGRDDRLHQPHQEGAHRHPRGPHRVRAPEPGVPHQPARGRRPHPELRARPEGGPARGPGHRPRRRDARPGDDRPRPGDREHRPSRVRHPAHQQRHQRRGPHHRPVPRRPAGADPQRARRRAARGGGADPAAQEGRRPHGGPGDPGA